MTNNQPALRPIGACLLAVAIAALSIPTHSPLPFILVMALFVTAAIDLGREAMADDQAYTHEGENNDRTNW